jgi:hypothetical protein
MIPDVLKIIVRLTPRNGIAWSGLLAKTEVPPPPSPLTGIIELARNSRQNPLGKGVRYHNIENKRLTVWLFRLLRTVTASTMIARLRGCAQGQMSQVGCGKFLDGLRIDVAVCRRGLREVGDEDERPDTPGPPDSRGRLSPHEFVGYRLARASCWRCALLRFDFV